MNNSIIDRVEKIIYTWLVLKYVRFGHVNDVQTYAKRLKNGGNSRDEK